MMPARAMLSLLAGGLLFGGQIIIRNSNDPDNIRVPSSIAWATQSPSGGSVIQPNWTSYLTLTDDPVSGKLLVYAARSTSSIIYSTDVFAYDAVTPSFTHLGGTGSVIAEPDTDGSSSSVQPWPGDRHQNQRHAAVFGVFARCQHTACVQARRGMTRWMSV